MMMLVVQALTHLAGDISWFHGIMVMPEGMTGLMARNLATQMVDVKPDDTTCLEAYLSCRLIPPA